MANKFEKRNNIYKIIGTKYDINYSFIVSTKKILAISVEANNEKTTYYFNPKPGQEQVNSYIFETALKAILNCNIEGFDKLCTYIGESKDQEEYYMIAIRIFKEYWEHLRNLKITNAVFLEIK